MRTGPVDRDRHLPRHPHDKKKPAPEEDTATSENDDTTTTSESESDSGSSSPPDSTDGVLLPPTSEIAIPPNAYYISASTGDDASAGSATQPWRTLSKAISSVAPGDVVVLKPGIYGEVGTTTTFRASGSESSPIVFTSDPDAEPAIIRGYTRVTGSHLRLNELVFDGPTGAVSPKTSENPGGEQVQVSIMYGTDVELSNSEVRDNAWHAGVFVSKTTDTRIRSSYIHDNGDAATGANLDHGIYWSSGSGVVTNNWIEDNVARGVQLYPEATGVAISRNTITGNGRGGVIVARESSRNQLLNNVVAYNTDYGVRAYRLSGSDNVARDNLLWENDLNIYGDGISFSGTVIADPATGGDGYGAVVP